jgi:N-acyl homoserine lactone hydrolase
VLPTPGHTAGHQSVVVCCEDGSVVLAGQAHDTATEFAADLRAAVARGGRSNVVVPPYLAWMDRLLAFDPRRIVFAHDLSVVEPLR